MKLVRFYLLALTILLSACTTTHKPVLGESVTFKPGWEVLKKSASEVIAGPRVWASLLGAAVLQVSDLDTQLSDQMREHTPLFGSNQRANERSSDFRSLTSAAYVSTALLASGPAGSGP